MDYTIRILRKCKEYGFKVYMDPHQDIVSAYKNPFYASLSHCGNTFHHRPYPFFVVPFPPDPLPECPTWLTNI